MKTAFFEKFTLNIKIFCLVLKISQTFDLFYLSSTIGGSKNGSTHRYANCTYFDALQNFVKSCKKINGFPNYNLNKRTWLKVIDCKVEIQGRP